MAISLESERVLLREWLATDLDPWIALNLDPENLRYFPRVYTEEESRASFDRISDRLNSNQYGLWAAVEKVAPVVTSHTRMVTVGVSPILAPGMA